MDYLDMPYSGYGNYAMDIDSIVNENNVYTQSRSNSPQFTNVFNAENDMSNPENKPYGCYYCGFRYGYKYYLVKHMNTHIREKPYKCSGCKKKYNRKEYLNQHALVNIGNKTFGCTDCGTPFMYGSSFSQTQE